MSVRYPIISVTGSSGAGTTSVKRTFEQIFRREGINACYIEGDAFHRYDRIEMRNVMEEESARGNNHFSHFGPAANLLDELEEVFRTYSARGVAKTRHYVHDEAEAALFGQEPGTFTEWKSLQAHSDLLFYEGLHGASVTDKVNIARHADLKIGVVPVINLEWIQKIHRDRADRGYTTEAVMDTILRRMPDYTRYICPQFTETDINFQRVPTVDTSNPFTARWIPTADESMVIIRFAKPSGIDFPYLLSMIHDSFMSRANSIVIPGAKLDIAMQLILTPFILQLVERRRRLTQGRKFDERAHENF
ncbi:Phosphoribulokinase [Methylocella silvestris BL2]|uniref:Phosphoribulokinase n=1 Tax=Methylocella silvestris (strain DSM 15510 / CIP 108128 / LMG 27833 / NCIMB 13906 / BL2) TaxID=395965 RepID=B8EPF6_METSB|nr:phosphoribulokinase [Methylocella silvestris]ACK50161.1 Phosphoribulokinase [Methylocella silvestris BL2]